MQRIVSGHTSPSFDTRTISPFEVPIMAPAGQDVIVVTVVLACSASDKNKLNSATTVRSTFSLAKSPPVLLLLL